MVSSSLLERAAFWCAFGSALTALASIAASQILLALAVALLLVSGTRWRLPPVWLPLALFMALTVVSLLASGDPAAGRPQIRKFFVYLTLPVIFSAFRELKDARRLFLAWGALGALAAARGLVQFADKYSEARRLGRRFYDYYVAERITGFMSHHMTFSGGLMIALMLLAAYLFFAPSARGKRLCLGLLAAALMALALLLGFTRSVWLASAAGVIYLVWFWQRRLLVALPVLAAVVLGVGPSWVRSRVVSALQPHGQLDSNQHRIVCWRIGWRMIQARPLVGVGPERVQARLMEFVPADVPRPLPEGWYGHLHSIYVHYAAERGVPAMLMLVWFLAQALWQFLRALRRLPSGRSDEKFLLHGAAAAVLAVAVAGLFELNLGDSEVLAMFLAVIACGYLAVEKTPQPQPATGV
jgi:putative inorganic carbon (HCO3(-)) transporter